MFNYDFILTEHSGICYGKLQELAEQYNSILHTSTMALAFLPEYSVQKQLLEGTLVMVDVDIEPQIYYSQIIVHKRRWLSPFMKGLIEKVEYSQK